MFMHRMRLCAPIAGLLRFALYCLALCLASGPAFAGVTAASTRVVFSAGATEQSLQLVNLNQYPVVVQTWVDDGRLDAVPEESTSPIITVPPIFRMNQGDQTSLRLINSGAPCPKIVSRCSGLTCMRFHRRQPTCRRRPRP
jgi:P pilus assembly chaperone PapD